MIQFQKYITNGQNSHSLMIWNKNVINIGICVSRAWDILDTTDCVSIDKWSARLQISKLESFWRNKRTVVTNYVDIKNRIIIYVIHFDLEMKFTHLRKRCFTLKSFVDFIETFNLILWWPICLGSFQ